MSSLYFKDEVVSFVGMVDAMTFGQLTRSTLSALGYKIAMMCTSDMIIGSVLIDVCIQND